MTEDSVLASLAVFEVDDEESSCNEWGCDVLPELSGWGCKEIEKELKFDDELSTEQQSELEELADDVLGSNLDSCREHASERDELCGEYIDDLCVYTPSGRTT
ncbi:hypothetical protein PoB_005220300 [Plakobranchus ocellatus]|uniref:Uncharacterized protein n=1 Tax=Plakobranchus ocellatus TaxID=259542 RepID=A0AAV4C2S0_9GAST|nr:hypothetical protein PoB_005220300 [Plakobranchus ocellatus]